jgi:two-component system, oxyanion-binding sensor
MMPELRIGFVPLVDAALPILAHELGLDVAHGVQFKLHKEGSWATIRDKLQFGLVDAAHILAPAAIAMSRGLRSARVPLIAPVALGLNGNAIVVAPWLADAIATHAPAHPMAPDATAAALYAIHRERALTNLAPLRLGIVYPFSSHTYLVHHWLGRGGFKDLSAITLQVVPPPFMTDSLNRGLIDGFCVGAPWGQEAVRKGHGVLLHLSAELISDCPEKVLAFRAADVNGDAKPWRQAVRAVASTSLWLADPLNRSKAADLLSTDAYLGIAPDVIANILTGHRQTVSGANTLADAIRLGPDAIEPKPAHEALIKHWMAADLASWPLADDHEEQAAVYRADLFHSALGHQ